MGVLPVPRGQGRQLQGRLGDADLSLLWLRRPWRCDRLHRQQRDGADFLGRRDVEPAGRRRRAKAASARQDPAPASAKPEPTAEDNRELAQRIWRRTPRPSSTVRRSTTSCSAAAFTIGTVTASVGTLPALGTRSGRLHRRAAGLAPHRLHGRYLAHQARHGGQGRTPWPWYVPMKGNCSPIWWPDGDQGRDRRGPRGCDGGPSADGAAMLGGTIGRQYGRAAGHPGVDPLGHDHRRRGRCRPPWRAPARAPPARGGPTRPCRPGHRREDPNDVLAARRAAA